MKAHGMPTAVHYPLPLHLQPVFAHLGQRAGAFPVSEARRAPRDQPADASRIWTERTAAGRRDCAAEAVLG